MELVVSNLIYTTDSYKVGHYCQYPFATQKVHSYFESRGGEFPETTFFGLQYAIKKHLLTPVTYHDVEEARHLFSQHFGNAKLFYDKGWLTLINRHGGNLPISIHAVPEGMSIPVSNVLMTVENTDPDFWWLTSYLETLLVQTWYPTTVATNSREIKKIIASFLMSTTGAEDGLEFKLHDFGFRGVTCAEQAGIGGAAHLVNFMGTDTLQALVVARDYYDCPMAGFSIPASEHSTITAWGRDGEYDAFENMLQQHPTGLVACVSDSYNIYEAAKVWGTRFKDQIMNREGTLVIRPDSGYPPHVVVRLLDILGEYFGIQTNIKGFKELPPQVRVIQGDGIDREMVKTILYEMKSNGWAASNVAFGSGGGLLQKFNRDTCKFAFKASAIMVDNAWNDNISKDPITDPGKRSKAGRLTLAKDATGFHTVPVENIKAQYNVMHEVYRDGELLEDDKLSDIRARAALKTAEKFL